MAQANKEANGASSTQSNAVVLPRTLAQERPPGPPPAGSTGVPGVSPNSECGAEGSTNEVNEAELAVDRFLKTLSAEEGAPPDLESAPSPLVPGPKKVHWWYERLADWMISNPDKYLKDAAVVFDVSPGWLYALQRSDTFQDYWTKRSSAVSISVEQKAQVLADRLIDSFQQDLDSADAIQKPLPTSTRLQILDVTMKRFGYGETKKPPTQPTPGSNVTNNYLGVVSQQELKSARDRLAQSQEAKRIAHTLEGEAAVAVKLP